jgi:hypothetical protein
LQTYKTINARYYQAKKEKQAKLAAAGGAGHDARKLEEYQVGLGEPSFGTAS